MSGFLVEDNILLRYDGREADIVIPDGVIAIGEWSFWSNAKIRSLTIPCSVRSIGYGAFFGCSALTSVILPESVGEIGPEAFADCRSLGHIVISAAACTVSESAFRGCREDADLYAPMAILRGDLCRMAALTYLRRSDAFPDGENRKAAEAYILSHTEELLPGIFREDLAGAMDFLAGNGRIDDASVDTDMIDPATAAGAHQCTAFLLEWKNRRGSFALNDPSIGLDDLSLDLELSGDLFSPAEMEKQWSYSVLADGSISLDAYKGQDEEVYLPPRIGDRPVSKLGDGLFFQNEKLQHILFAENPVQIGRDAFRGCRALQDAAGLEHAVSIGDAAFRGCSSLSKVALSDALTVIGAYAFSNCNMLSSVHFPAELRKIGTHAFSWTALRDAALPAGVETIGSGAFAYCTDLRNIGLPEKLAFLGEYAFRGCIRLTDIRIPAGVRCTGSMEQQRVADGGLRIADGLLENCSALSCAEIENGITSIGRSAFSGCSGLKEIVIPSGVTKIESDAFSRSGLEHIVIPTGVKEIGPYAFGSCRSLKQVVLSSADTVIDPAAFAYSPDVCIHS